nr:ABC transporter substrate-binding protein [Paenibacillus sacheonensis]
MLRSKTKCCAKNAFALLASLLITSLLLGGCAQKTSGGESAEQGTIRIALPNKDSYAYWLGDYVSAAYPELKVELIDMEPDYRNPATLEEYERKLKAEKPDLVLLGFSGKYPGLTADGLLEDLSLRMSADGMKQDDYYPGMLEKLKREGGGNLYAVTPAFQAYALYYNADLFHKYNVSLPRNGMTMMDVMDLASQFARAGSHKDGIVGYHQPFGSMPNQLLFTLSNREGVQAYDFRSGHVTIDTPAWRKIISTVVELYKNGTFLMQDVKGEMIDGTLTYGPDEVNEADLFKKGKSAMTIAGYHDMSGLKFETGRVTPPVSSVDMQRSVDISMNNYMAIPAGAERADLAWEIIRFMLSDYVAKVKSGLDEDMPVNKAYMNYDTDPLLPALYEILPSNEPSSVSMEGYDPKFTSLFFELEDREIAAAVKGEKSVEACIAAIQKEGQALMDAAKPKK